MEKINYDRIFEDTVKNLNGERKSLLLHSCCAPCSTAVLERVVEHFKVTVFFFNPNITESEEYDTLAGYIISMYGRIPQDGEELRAEKFEIKILKREQSRLDLVSFKRLE